MDGILEKQMLSQFGVVELGIRLGSIWSLMSITIGLAARRYNQSKANFSQQLRQRKEQLFAEKHLVHMNNRN